MKRHDSQDRSTLDTTGREGESAWQRNCPVPMEAWQDRIMLAHGEGARMTRRLLADTILPPLSPRRSALPGTRRRLEDAACLPPVRGRMAVSTDSHTVSPLFFPGGDAGSLSVIGTVNDLIVAGAVPRWLTLALIIEEGFPIAVLQRLLSSAGTAAERCGVDIVAGDTKVVPRGAVDGVFLNTTGLGELADPVPPGPQEIQAGDVFLVSGPIGRHGIAVLCARHQLALQPPPQSDLAWLGPAMNALREAVGSRLRCVRDATRGGVSAVLHEWAEESTLTFSLQEHQIPVTDDVRGACELLGLDPLYVANEGTLVAAVAADAADTAIKALRSAGLSAGAAIIGTAIPRLISPVVIRRTFGAAQPLDEPSGAPLPRIC